MTSENALVEANKKLELMQDQFLMLKTKITASCDRVDSSRNIASDYSHIIDEINKEIIKKSAVAAKAATPEIEALISKLNMYRELYRGAVEKEN